MKIRSKTDVITNSSTEVFNIVTKYNVEKLRELVNSILELSHSPRDCDEFFDISLDYSKGSFLWNIPEYADFKNDGETRAWEELEEEEKEKFMTTVSDSTWECYSAYPELKVKAKTKNISKELIWLLETVGNNIGGHEATSNS